MVFVKNLDLLTAQTDKLFSKAEEAFVKLSEDVKHSKPKELFCDGQLIKSQLELFSVVELYAAIEG